MNLLRASVCVRDRISALCWSVGKNTVELPCRVDLLLAALSAPGIVYTASLSLCRGCVCVCVCVRVRELVSLCLCVACVCVFVCCVRMHELLGVACLRQQLLQLILLCAPCTCEVCLDVVSIYI